MDDGSLYWSTLRFQTVERGGSACLDSFRQLLSGAWRFEPTRPRRLVLLVHAIGRASVKRATRPDLIAEGHVARHPLVGIADGLVGMKIDLFVFEAPPQPFHEHIILSPSPRPIHIDLNLVVFQKFSEFLARELAALIGVADQWRTLADGLQSPPPT